MDECGGFEIRCSASYRGFESLTLRPRNPLILGFRVKAGFFVYSEQVRMGYSGTPGRSAYSARTVFLEGEIALQEHIPKLNVYICSTYN